MKILKTLLLISFCLLSFGLPAKPVFAQMPQDSGEDIADSYYKKDLRDYYYNQGKEFYAQRNYQEAVFKFKSALKSDPDYKPAATFLTLAEGIIAGQQKVEEQKSTREKEKKDELAKENFSLYYYKQGMFYFGKADYKEAIVRFKEALKWVPDYKPALKYLVLSEDRLNQKNKAEDERAIREAKKEEAKSKEQLRNFYYSQGLDHFKHNRYNEAILSFKQSLVIDPQYKPAIKYIVLSEDKITRQQKQEEQTKITEEKKKAEQERKEKLSADRKLAEERLAQERAAAVAAKKAVLDAKKATEEAARKASLESRKAIVETKKTIVDQPVVQQPPSEKAAVPGVLRKLTANGLSINEANPGSIIYKLDKEDALEISVWRHPELTKEVIVGVDGMISYPLINDIMAQGLTIPELKQKITQGLEEFSQKRFKGSLSGKGGEAQEYLIDVGDTLDISVWKVADLSKEVIVRPDGMISYPLIGDLKAAGLTLSKLSKDLTDSLKKYVKEPQVSVMIKSFGWKKDSSGEMAMERNPEVSIIIKKFGGRKVLVLGEVIKPGVYTYNGDIRLAEAIALAGDFTKYAVKSNILVIRGNIHNNPEVIKSDVLNLLKSGDLSQNLLVQPQDIIFVPRTLIGNINTFLESISPAIDTVYKGATTQFILKQ